MKSRATVLLAVSSAIVEAGLRAVIARIKDLDVAVETASAIDLPERVARLRPSLLIVEPLSVPPGEIASLRDMAGLSMRVAVLYVSALPQDVSSHYDTALSIYASPEKIVSTVRDAALKARGIDDGTGSDDDRRELSPREKDVVVGVVKGLSNKEIAAAMGVSVNTVTTHRRNIASKLKIHSPAGLTIYAIVSKLVPLEDVSL